MATYKLSNYINKLEALYSTAREDYNKATKALAELEKSHKEKLASGELNAVGQQRERERYETKKREYTEAITAARETFTTGAAEVRQTVDTLFRGLYRPDTKSMDLQAVEMIKSGMLSQPELLEMAASYKEQGNIAMYRFCGTFVDERYSPEAKSLAAAAKMPLQRVDLQHIDSFTDMCLKGLRDDVVLADGIDKHHEEWYTGFIADTDNIAATVDTPWDK